jgi:hypothetical protein
LKSREQLSSLGHERAHRKAVRLTSYCRKPTVRE